MVACSKSCVWSPGSREEEDLAEVLERLDRILSQLRPSRGGDGSSGVTGSVGTGARGRDMAMGWDSPPKMITFDLDDTLWDTWSVLTKAHIAKQRHLEHSHPR